MLSLARVTVVLGLLLLAPAASAHLSLTSPKPRTEEQKTGPCGVGAGDKRGSVVTNYRPGEKITVTWKETVPHPGHFRISFDSDGQDGFKDPATATELNSAPTVLVDDIADKEGLEDYSQEVTLPNVECNNCTLQVIQLMTDKPPYGDGNDLYYQCADLVLSKTASTPPKDAGTPAGRDASAGDDDDADDDDDDTTPANKTPSRVKTSPPESGCVAVHGTSELYAVPALAMIALVAMLRRRRR